MWIRPGGGLPLAGSNAVQLGPAFVPDGPYSKKTIGEVKAIVESVMQGLAGLWGGSTIREILRFCDENKLCALSPQLRVQLDRDPRPEAYDAEVHSSEKGDWLADAFMAMSTEEIDAVAAFVAKNTPCSTQHGSKGEEYDKVLVVFDDTEAAWTKYSFGKTLIPNTMGEPTEGQRERSRKLAYVCFSRAAKDLRILLFTPNPHAAKDELVSAITFRRRSFATTSSLVRNSLGHSVRRRASPHHATGLSAAPKRIGVRLVSLRTLRSRRLGSLLFVRHDSFSLEAYAPNTPLP